MQSSIRCLAILFAVGGCADIAGFNNNPQMRPGQDCLSCHTPSGVGSALSFTVAGTVYPSALAGTLGGANDVEIDIVDANNRRFVMLSNGAGNFYSAEPIELYDAGPAAQVSVRFGGQEFVMRASPPSGHCNGCHALEANSDGTFQAAALLPDSGLGTRTPGHIFAFAPDGCPPVAPASCPDTVPSYANQVQNIILANCGLCHGVAGHTPPILLTHGDVVASIEDAGFDNLGQVEGCKMPPADDGTYFPMSPDERKILTTWLACGYPDN